MKLVGYMRRRPFNKKPGIFKSDPRNMGHQSLVGLINTAFYVLFTRYITARREGKRGRGRGEGGKEKKGNIFLQCGNACNAPKVRLTVRLVTRGSCNAYDGNVLFVSSCKLVPAGEVVLLDQDLSNLISYCRITPPLFSIVVSYATCYYN